MIFGRITAEGRTAVDFKAVEKLALEERRKGSRLRRAERAEG